MVRYRPYNASISNLLTESGVHTVSERSLHMIKVFKAVIGRAELHFDIKNCHKVATLPEKWPYLIEKIIVWCCQCAQILKSSMQIMGKHIRYVPV